MSKAPAPIPQRRADRPMGPGRPSRAKVGRRRELGAALLKQRTALLFRQLPLASSGDEEAVHQVRVWSRRVRVALELLTEKPAGHRARRAQHLLRRLARTAGGARDLDVMVDTFRRRLRALAAPTAEQRQLGQRLAALRRRGRARAVVELRAFEAARLAADLANLAARRGPHRLVIGERLRVLAARQGRKLEDGFLAVGAHLDVPALHSLRRRARRMRYAVEISAEVCGGPADATRPWKLLQERIGGLHDHHLLSVWLERQAQAAARHGQTALAAAATAEIAWTGATMARLHDELLADDPRALVAHALAALAPPPPVTAD